MAIAALVVAIVSALTAVAALVYARRLDKAAKEAVAAAQKSAESSARSATASETRAELESQRRQDEMTPHFRLSWDWEKDRLTMQLTGPPQLGRLDSLTVRIRDDHPWRAEGSALAGGPSQEEVAAQIWGPYRFIPGSGPGASPGSDVGAADATGRVTPTHGMPVGESLAFALEPTRPPHWSQQPVENWRRERGTFVRLQLDCVREGWSPWSLAGEVDTAAGAANIVLP